MHRRRSLGRRPAVPETQAHRSVTVDLPYRQYGEDEPTSDDQRAPTGAEASVDFAAARRSWRARLLIGGSLVVAVGLLGLLVLSLAQKQGSFAGFAINAVGQLGRVNPGPAPDFTVPLYAGGTFRLSAERGHVVVVNYWASWCPPCRDEAPVRARAW